ncbi:MULTISPECIES: ArsA family ATPase [unclassified Azospirillum]|uniref:ArsA family ATPase n=1 Tax=unclassified Azospirillum TaxID=2630922 RepID=UPI000B674EC4|nr:MULTISPECIES: TRC40/GET3/ArsA family transport-energizing ATPase [unclassified Azospirillum]SNS95046.1 arsenite efflux ATP-binding protein ArsA [Azospirillum sp. RU38E]SNT11490.1 arsenite efflux ATP-binding protein ArsA [Azospirillum sp. RU37A]
MPRIILMSGKGGVGKTTVSAATGLACAQKGHRTIVVSFDLAHSLFDCFDLPRGLFDHNGGEPVRAAENLDVQEIDVQMEIEKHWGDIYRYLAMLMTSSGLTDVIAEEVAVIPGMEDVIALMYVNKYMSEGKYDVIVLDCPPTSESLRFVSMTSTIEWYVRKRFNVDRNIVRFAGPIAKRFTDYKLPDEKYFTAMMQLFERITGVDKMLVDPETTSVRLVTQAEKMVIRETQRAFMYFNMYGVAVDRIVINRLLPDTPDGYYSRWVKAQTVYAQEVREYFDPVPTVSLPLFDDEVIGVRNLQRVADALFSGGDPAQFYHKGAPYTFTKEGEGYLLTINLPFVDKSDLDISRHQEDLTIRIGTFKRHVPLPRSVLSKDVQSAKMVDGVLQIRF